MSISGSKSEAIIIQLLLYKDIIQVALDCIYKTILLQNQAFKVVAYMFYYTNVRLYYDFFSLFQLTVFIMVNHS